MKCEDCIHVHSFIPRPDEQAKGWLLGCNKPGWEGYTQNEKPACGGTFFSLQTLKRS